jgi:lipopolysaccharide/colanic/teichoic acid biosynthesis glycosyltransferase
VAAFQRFAVMPGITGLWQVSGRSQLSFTEMIALDAEYVRRRSFWLNLSILLRTPLVVLRGHGAA